MYNKVLSLIAWDLVYGMKYIWHFGIFLSIATETKILLLSNSIIHWLWYNCENNHSKYPHFSLNQRNWICVLQGIAWV